ncbi:hypothetical protein J6590_032827 [Homalodisca vitripennis]|nr:hypothetical protein J6590_032827 [Homalodisca vitripennis]
MNMYFSHIQREELIIFDAELPIPVTLGKAELVLSSEGHLQVGHLSHLSLISATGLPPPTLNLLLLYAESNLRTLCALGKLKTAH